MARTSKYPQELRERAVRMVLEHQHEYPSQWKAIESVAEKLAVHRETLRQGVRRAEVDSGSRPGVTSEERVRIRELERENRELRRANDHSESGRVFLRGGARPPLEEVIRFIDEHRDDRSGTLRWGVEPICAVLQVAPSSYYAAKSRPPSARSVRDEELKVEIVRVYEENVLVYGADKVWTQLNREEITVARCTVERLMGVLGLSGARRGKAFVITTDSDHAYPRPADLVDRKFKAPAPNRFWVADIERHEAFSNRAVMEGHRRVLVAAGALKLRAA